MSSPRIVDLAHACAGSLCVRSSTGKQAKTRFSWRAALTRAMIGLLGGLILALAFTTGTSAVLVALHWMTRADAVVMTGMLAFLVWTVAVLVAFGAGSLRRAAGWVLGGCAVFAALGLGANCLLQLA